MGDRSLAAPYEFTRGSESFMAKPHSRFKPDFAMRALGITPI